MTTVTDTYREVFGRAPTGVWSAPGRVNLVGEHTDYNDGLVLPIALPMRTVAAGSARDDDLVVVHSRQVGETVTVALAEVGPDRPGGWAAYVAGVVWALREDGHAVGGLEVAVDSDVPVGAGLSSSAALECAVAAASSELSGLTLLETPEGRARLARACVRAENDIAGAPTGGMDQSVALLARSGHALLLDCRDGAVEHVPFDLGPDHALLVTDTRAEHALNDGQYAARRDACRRAAEILGVSSLREVVAGDLAHALHRLPDDELRARTRHVVREIERVREAVTALRAHDLVGLGRIFDASHASLRDDYEVSCPELDVSVEAARSAGALGARMTGGGFGGSSIAIVPVDAVAEVVESVRLAFAHRGWGHPDSFTVTAGHAARREH